MTLDFEYGINTGNRFLDLVDHDEDPDVLIAGQAQPEEKTKKSKDAKTVSSATTKKSASKTTTSTTTTAASTAKTNKENLTGKSTNTDQRRQQTNVLGDNNNQQARVDSGRGGGRGFGRRGGSAGQDRPQYEGGNRGGGQQRPQRYHKFEGQQQTSNEGSGFEQRGESWGNEAGNDNQSYGGYRGRGRGRGGPRRGNYEGGRGDGRGRGRGGRGYYSNRNFEEGSQQQQQQPTQETSGWQQSTESNFNNTQTAQTGGEEVDANLSAQDQSFEPSTNNRRGGRGQFRSRTFHNNRNYGQDRQNQYEREGDQEDYRHNRRQHDRQPRSNLSGVKPIEKKDGEGAHNWGSSTENPEDNPIPDETTEAAGQAGQAQKGWAEQVDEAEKQMTLDEYKKQIEEKKRTQQEKLPQFNRRTAGEGEDPKNWQKFEQEYRKKNDGEESGEEDEEGSGDEENESGEELEEEQASGKKKVINIPLYFKPIDMPRGGPAGSRGGPRRGGSGRFRDRPSRDDQQRPKSPSQQQQQTQQQQQQQPPAPYQQTGEYQNTEQQSRPYRGGPRGGSGRSDYRRPYGNSTRGSRGGYNRSNANTNTPDFDNTVDFPTLPNK